MAGRLARHLGGSKLYWQLTVQAWRQKSHLTRFQMQRVYAVMEKWGNFAAWQASHKLDQTEAETEKEKADGLICQGFCRVVFRDFDAAEGFFSQAQALTSNNPWV